MVNSMNKELEEKLKNIIAHYGPFHQTHKLFEEVDELREERARIKPTKNLTRELADVFILAYQMYLVDEAVRREVDCKVDRTIKRITEECYFNE